MPSNLSWIDKLTLSREFGFDYLEMSIDETDEKLKRLEWTSHEVKALRDDILRASRK